MFFEYPIYHNRVVIPRRANNEIRRATATLYPSKSLTTIPMTGLSFGFSVQEADQRAVTGLRNDPSFDNYTREQLAKLNTEGLYCVLDVPSLVNETVAQTTSKEPKPQLICFPWGIFEAYGVFKSPEANDISFASAISQVSAVASTALSMFERLAKFADERHDGQHIPPVSAITSVGANTTVWLASCDIVDDKIRDHVRTLNHAKKKRLTNQQKMISMSEGTITNVWDAIQLCRIIDNIFFWAQHCVKPKVTQYLSQWRLRYCPDVPNIHSLLEMDTRTVDIVHRIQDRLSSLGLFPNEDLPALVRQAVVFQEVMRPSNKEVKADSTSKEEKKLPAAAVSLPSHPRGSSLEVAISSPTGYQQATDPQIRPKGKEIPHQQRDFPGGKSEKGTADSSKLHNTHILQLKSPPKHQTTSLLFPDKDKESTSDNSIVLEDMKSESSMRYPLSCNFHVLILFPAASTDIFTNKQTLTSKLPTNSKADRRSNNVVYDFDPRKIKTSSAEERKGLLPGSLKEPDEGLVNN